MKKNILLFFTFVVCFSTSLFAGFKEAAELFEQENYIEAYDEFFACYQNNDLRGNAYLRHLILTKKIDDVRKEFWSEEEYQKLEDTTSIRSENSLKASLLHQVFLKDNAKFISANKNKRKKIENGLKIIIKNLINMHNKSNARASIVLAQLSEDIELRKRFSLCQSHTYYDVPLQYVDRDVFISAFQKGYLNRKGYETYKLYAQFLERFPANGEGELKIAHMCKSKKDPVAESRWLIRAACLGNQEAYDRVLKDYLYLITDLNPPVGRNPLRDNDVLVCVYKAAHELKDDGFYTLLMGNFFDISLKNQDYIVPLLNKDNKKALYWYKKAKDFGFHLGLRNYHVLRFREIVKQHTVLIDKSEKEYIVCFLEDALNLDKHSTDLDVQTTKNMFSGMVFNIIEKFFFKESFDHFLALRAFDLVIENCELFHRNIAKFYKAIFL